MTNAERIARWRERHARKLARKNKVPPTPWTLDEYATTLMFTAEDLERQHEPTP